MNIVNAKADAAFQQARQLFEQQRHEDALKALDTSISHEPSARAWRSKGYIYKLQRQFEQAAEALEAALEIDPRDHISLSLMAEIRVAEENIDEAVAFYILAIEANPDNLDYKENFILLAGKTIYESYNEKAANALVACLRTPDIESVNAQILWLSLFETLPGIKKLYEVTPSAKGPVLSGAELKRGVDLFPLDTPLFIEGLKRIAVYHPMFELFLTRLRRHLLLDLGPEALSPLHLRLAAALGHYALFTEFIFNQERDEEEAAAALTAYIGAGKPHDEAALCLYACYHPLASLPDAADIAVRMKSSDDETVRSLASVHIDDLMALEADKPHIPRLTPIENETSCAVRAQYEIFPYPRWKKLTGVKVEPNIAARLPKKPMRILVAGCGTGREALNAAITFKNSSVLAVDLSLSSLAYGRSQARKLGITNVDFYQGDILKLGDALEERFDYITSSGVLNALKDPEDGWRVLAGLLKPDGIIRMGLYSELGRKAVVAGRSAIAKGGYGDDAAEMRRFRKDMHKLLSPLELLDLIGFGDFYHMSMFRDLLFHVQEHRFDIPQIGHTLEKHGLEFLHFNVKKDAEALYRQHYPDGPHSLENWHALEQKNPTLFREMYFFWCAKKS